MVLAMYRVHSSMQGTDGRFRRIVLQYITTSQGVVLLLSNTWRLKNAEIESTS